MNNNRDHTPKKKRNDPQWISRRDFLKGAAVAAGAAAVAGCGVNDEFFDTYFRRHYREMSKEEIDRMITALESRYEREYDRDFTIDTTPALQGVLFGYALDIARCIGCRRCVYACVDENNQSRDPQIQWIQVYEMDKGKGIDFDHATPYYEADKVPREGKFYMPVACQHCENPPCTKVCPVGATWKEKDGIVVIDYDWCIGCRYCMAACPYGARHFNWRTPKVPSNEINPHTHYLGNRPRYKGVVEKCTFCVQRVRKGRYPACVEICPVGARKFGNLLDPDSEVRHVLATKRIYVLKKELNTQPKFFYYWGI